MHHTIIFLIEADDGEEALEFAREELDDLIKYNTIGVDGGSFSGDQYSRYNGKPFFSFKSKEGKLQLLGSIHATWRDYRGDLNKVKKIIKENSTEEIFRDHLYRYNFTCVGENSWICHEKHFIGFCSLNIILETVKHRRLWIVPCDVHS